MKILALNPFHGGSHRAFLDGWMRHSTHEFHVLSLPARKWKWRMRHAPVEFARQLEGVCLREFDVLFSTDMLDLPTLRGLCPDTASLPAVVYFHENQLTYPVRTNAVQQQRDMHFAFTNLLTAASANRTWFNSKWHLRSFLDAAAEWIKRFPDFQPDHLLHAIEGRADVFHPGIDPIEPAECREPGPLRIAWVSRWEFDKNPEVFFDALRIVKQRGVEFRLFVFGESYGEQPECFARAASEFADNIDHWGFAKDREGYANGLRQCDVVVSTALHEFFGLAIVEAVSAGCYPLVPQTLAYPEVLRDVVSEFHLNTPESLADQIVHRAQTTADNENVNQARTLSRRVSRYSWPEVAPRLDENILLSLDNT